MIRYSTYLNLSDKIQYISLSNLSFALLLYMQVFLNIQFFVLYFSPCTLSLRLEKSDSYSIMHQTFADDLQLQMSAPTDEISMILHSMQSCINDIKVWATANMLKLNDNKTGLMFVTPKGLIISIAYLLHSQFIMVKFLETFCKESWSYVGLSSYYE